MDYTSSVYDHRRKALEVDYTLKYLPVFGLTRGLGGITGLSCSHSLKMALQKPMDDFT